MVLFANHLLCELLNEWQSKSRYIKWPGFCKLLRGRICRSTYVRKLLVNDRSGQDRPLDHFISAAVTGRGERRRCLSETYAQAKISALLCNRRRAVYEYFLTVFASATNAPDWSVMRAAWRQRQ